MTEMMIFDAMQPPKHTITDRRRRCAEIYESNGNVFWEMRLVTAKMGNTKKIKEWCSPCKVEVLFDKSGVLRLIIVAVLLRVRCAEYWIRRLCFI